MEEWINSPSTFQLPSAQYPLVVIVGETASGKSALAIKLARQLQGEIICADSLTVRREVNIGSSKPSLKDRSLVPHHLVDIVEPCTDFTAAVFKRLALSAIEDITSRGKLPILAGGTGLYIDGIIFDYGFMPEGDRQKRLAYNALSAEKLQAAVKAKGLSLDNIDIRNKRRLIRLLETGGLRPTRGNLRAHTLLVGLYVPREVLKGRIINRVDNMIKEGLENEVRDLAAKYGWSCEALKGIGYREWREYIDGSQDLTQTRDRIIKSTLELAKRQRTWFKRNKSIQWFENHSDVSLAVSKWLHEVAAC